MKTSWMRFAAILLTLVMVVGVFAGCGTKDEPSKEAEPTKESSKEVVDDTAEEPADASGAFEERVHITVPVYDRSKEGFPAVDDNYWTRWIQEEFGDPNNIEVEYVAIPRGDVMTKYSLLIAADDTPTILMEYDYPKVAQWANDGAMAVIDLDAFAEVAPTYYGKMVENDQLQYTDLNNETYFVLSERPYYDTPFAHNTFVRLDWLEAVGYDEVPKNYEEHKDAIEKIMEAGLTDAPPMGITVPTAAYVGNFALRDFPVDEKEWAMHSSLGTASLTWEPTYKQLKRQNAEYNAGWYSKEYEVQADDQMQTDFINGKTYSFGGYMSSYVDWLDAFYDNNPEGKLAIASEYAGDEAGYSQATLRADNPFGMIVGFSSLATDDELKAAWMLMEWMIDEDVLFTLENGIEGVTYTLDENGLPEVDTEYRGEEMLNHNNNIDMTCLIHASKQVGTIEDTLEAMTPQGLPQNFYEEFLSKYHDQVDIANTGKAYTDPIFAVPIEAETEYSASLLSLYQEYSVALVKANPDDFDALYEELSQKYLDAGYQEVMDERLEAFDAGQCTRLPEGAGK